MTDIDRVIRTHRVIAAASRSTAKPDPKAVQIQATLVSEEWDRWVTADDADAEFAFLEWAVGALRGALSGSRRMRLNKDQYGYWRSRCACGWSGSPWSGGIAGDIRSPREQAIDEFAAHDCLDVA